MEPDYFNSLNNFLNFVRRRRRQYAFFKNLLGLVFSILLVFLILNWPAYFLRINYALKNQPKKSFSQTSSVEEIATFPEKDLSKPSDPGQDRLEIEKIGVKAPISWNSTAETIKSDLEKGVVQIKGSSKPDERGTILMTGHSSDFWWRGGDYKTVFALLDKLSEGDAVRLVYNGRIFNFEVTGQQIIKPEEIDEVLALQTQRTLVLMTCWPIGTSWKRILMFAKPSNP